MAECEDPTASFNAIHHGILGLSLKEATGHRGLENPDSTCYLNAVLQTLFMTKEFKEHVLKMSDSSADNFIKELKKLFIELEKQEKTAVSAAEVTKSLGIEVHKQADAAEHLESIIRKTGSFEFFKGTLKTTRTCWKCSKKQKALEEFLSLIVSFEEYPDVEDAVQAYVDRVRGVYLPTCSCSEVTVWERQTFPKILIVQLRRLKMDSSGFRKNDLEVKIRPHIKVSFHKYDLYAIICHYDTDEGGHYYAHIKCEKEIWHRFNDKSVKKSDESSALSSSEAYLLVYRHRE